MSHARDCLYVTSDGPAPCTCVGGQLLNMPAMTIATLRHLESVGHIDLRKASEPLRQRLIALGMCEPPIVDVDADRVFLTEAGKAALAGLRC